MKQREGLVGARGQIAWILALIVSTAAIIQLERVDGISLADREPAADPALAGLAEDALAGAEARYAAAQDDPQAAASLLLALVAAVQAGVLEREEGGARAADVVLPTAEDDPDLQSARVLAALTFGESG